MYYFLFLVLVNTQFLKWRNEVRIEGKTLFFLQKVKTHLTSLSRNIFTLGKQS